MPTDLEQQVARFAEALDREAPTISFGDMVGRGTVAVDVDLLERESSDRARVNGVPWINTTPSRDEVGDRDVLIELAPALVVRRPAWRPVVLKVALGVAAVAVLVVTLAAIERDGDELDPADGFLNLTTTFEATVDVGGRLYLFTLSHDRSDARAVFDAFVATIDLTPETAAVP